MNDIRFEDRVAIVTGAGGGLGRSHALLLASRGASVVVNDLGGSLDGSGGGTSAADEVVALIKKRGGRAIANYASVSDIEGAAGMVAAAIEAFGRVDIVINNAGILRDTSFHKMTPSQWDAVMAVHLTGTKNVTHAAWPIFREQGYGRVVNTTSAAGLYGNFGQANYGAAKMGIVGFTRTLAQEGARKNIHVNCIAPVAKSRMTETIGLPEGVLDRLAPERVSPLVAYLVSEACEENGQIFAVGGGYIAKVAIVEAQGTVLSGDFSPEDVAASWDAIANLDGAVAYQNAMDAIRKALESAAKA